VHYLSAGAWYLLVLLPMKHWAIGRSDFIDLMGIASAVAVDRVSV
jgi:hypothetical protein